MTDHACIHCGRPATIALTTGKPDPKRVDLCGRCYARELSRIKSRLADNRRARRRSRRNTKPPPPTRLPL